MWGIFASRIKLLKKLSALRTECQELRIRAARQRKVIEHLVTIEDTLSASQERLQTTLNSIGDAVISTDTDGRVVSLNPVAEKLTGWGSDEARGRKLTDVFHIVNAHSRQEVLDPAERVLQSGSIVGLANHTLLISRDGTEYQIADSASPIRQPDATLIGVVLVFRDVTNEYRMQEQLLQNEALLEKSQEIGHIGSWQLDFASNELIWSDEVYRIFGTDRQHFSPSVETFYEMIPPEEQEAVLEAYNRSLEIENDTYEIEHRIIRKNTGEVRYVVEKCIHIRNSEGEITGSLGMVQDITERKHIEEQLRESRDSLKREKELFEYLFQTIPDHMYIKDRDSRFIRLNKSIVEMFGLTNEKEAIGKTDFDFFADEHARPAYEDEQEIMRTGIAKIGYEEKEDWPDGHVTWALSTKMPMYDNAGKIVGLIGISHNITNRKQVETEREHLMEMLEKKNEELKSIVYIASHDLRSPIVNINGFCGILSEHCHELEGVLEGIDLNNERNKNIPQLLKEHIPEDLYFIETSSKKMEHLINGLLQVSRIGTAKIEPVRINMDQLMHSIIHNMNFQIEQSNVHIQVDTLPDCVGDPGQIDRLFMNLIDNAIKYMDDNRSGVIHISGRREKQASIYCIEDNGIGIDQPHQSRIFELFHRLRPTGQVPGQGLGLTIVKRILDRNDGDIWIESQEGKGSKFFVSLPGIKKPSSQSARSIKEISYKEPAVKRSAEIEKRE